MKLWFCILYTLVNSPSHSTFPENAKLRCSEYQEYLIDKGSCSLKIEEISLDYDVNLEKLVRQDDTLPYLQSDGFCRPTLKHP